MPGSPISDRPVPAGEEDGQQNEDDNSSEDEDFNPGIAEQAEDLGSQSSDDDEDAVDGPAAGKAKAPRKRKASGSVEDGATLGELDSGDEVTIRKGKRRKGEGKAVGSDMFQDDGEGGEGGWVKTRAQRARESVSTLQWH